MTGILVRLESGDLIDALSLCGMLHFVFIRTDAHAL
jgi:hypothetical protein